VLDDAMLTQLREALEEQVGHLRREIVDQGADPDSDEVELSQDSGFSDRSHSTEERSRLISVVKALRSNLRDAEHALAKMEAGSYGTCERCGRPIPLERLEALPWVLLCMECKQKGITG
jgi:DnaK suppressor protein